MSLGQSCITVVSCLSWQSRYFSPPSMYSLHSWVCRLMTPALPLPRTLPPAPLSAAPDLGPLLGSAEWSSSSRRHRVARRRMAREERNQVSLGRLLSDGDTRRRKLVTAVWGERGKGVFKCTGFTNSLPLNTRNAAGFPSTSAARLKLAVSCNLFQTMEELAEWHAEKAVWWRSERVKTFSSKVVFSLGWP